MNNQENYKKNVKTINKGLIFLKSTVFALFIILVVLSISLVMFKSKKQQTNKIIANDCHHTKSIVIAAEIEKVAAQGKIINVLTKIDKESNSQDLIRIDASCGNEINRLHFNIKK